MSPPPTAAALVLDTNVVLDWLVFRDASTQQLEAALRSGVWRWHATTAMRTELEHVLTYPALADWNPRPDAVLAAWEAWVRPVRSESPSRGHPLRCTDPDDQMFIDLALQLGGCTLLSRDRAVLKLARRARSFGLDILTPERWTP
ncbi:putative toxin-antitoxin system toxin component, PIN family [uncultured Piscinibacter sp.]|mgnify:CR=1 FL=1|uniref:PIN domain-containing protein n=1 Tax=uncultured Piscinibacter sp. TaxID=1131835 RepID=UPI00263314BD|nr:PIN domain-containing protein [uncultured Piscinibacter sp.]